MGSGGSDTNNQISWCCLKCKEKTKTKQSAALPKHKLFHFQHGVLLEWGRASGEEDMKDVILITTCISVTDAYYYDIRNDFNCFKMLLRLFSPSFWQSDMLETFLQLHQKIKRVEWWRRTFHDVEKKFSIYLNLYRIMIQKSV